MSLLSCCFRLKTFGGCGRGHFFLQRIVVRCSNFIVGPHGCRLLVSRSPTCRKTMHRCPFKGGLCSVKTRQSSPTLGVAEGDGTPAELRCGLEAYVTSATN